jgi:hypothetical protein
MFHHRVPMKRSQRRTPRVGEKLGDDVDPGPKQVTDYKGTLQIAEPAQPHRRSSAATSRLWWRWGRVELPVQDPSPGTTTSVSDDLSSTARTGTGTLPDGPVTCP